MTGRIGLVLGAGGVLGFSWAVGALTALESSLGVDLREVEVLLGTSAGSVTAALLGNGVGVSAMLRHQRGEPAADDPVIGYDEEADGAGPLPPWPAPGLGSPALLARSVRHPGEVPPLAVLSAIVPRGRGTLAAVSGVVRAAMGGDGTGWTRHPRTWVVAMDYASGARVPFGRPGSPPADLPDAVAASCAIPGWFAPVRIGGARYVDGGTRSNTSLDLLAGLGLDHVYVVAPLVSFAYDQPAGVAARLARRVRRAQTRRTVREAAQVQAAGTPVTVLGPGPADLEAIGANLMDARRRADVLATSLRTSAAALAGSGSMLDLAGGWADDPGWAEDDPDDDTPTDTPTDTPAVPPSPDPEERP